MRVTQMVTDLIRGSVLTTEGDIVVRGASVPERLAIGSVFQALYVYEGFPTWIDPYYYLAATGAIPVMGSEAIDEIPGAADGLVLKSKGAGQKPAYETIYSLLTTQGDLIVRGAAAAERLLGAAAGLVLKSKGAGQKPAYEELYSLLTTWGDIIVRGETAALRLPIGTTDFVFTSRGAGQTPNWQYLYKLLTTQGDIIVRGAAAAERLAAALDGQFLKTKGAGTKPEWGWINEIKEVGTGGHTMKCKVIEIGDWNMVATATVTPSHDMPTKWKGVRSIDAMIRNDNDSLYYRLPQAGSDGTVASSITGHDSNVVSLSRVTGGFFDDTDFDSTSYNRGWVMFWYVV